MKTLANETNPLTYEHSTVDHSYRTLAEVAALGGKVTRLRIFIEGSMVDVSYLHATLPGGQIVTVETSTLSIRTPFMLKSNLIEWAKEQGVFAKGMGLLDEHNWSVLR